MQLGIATITLEKNGLWNSVKILKHFARGKIKTCLSVDCQQLKRAGFRSADCSTACSDFIPTSYMCSMMWGNLARYNLDVGGKMVAMGQEVRIWEETTSC
jgi:hypothetical protein